MKHSMLDWKSLSSDYARYHTHPLNRLTHIFGIPMIVFCVVRWTEVGNFPVPVAALALVLYALWDIDLAIVMAAAIAAMAVAAPYFSVAAVWGVFIAGWFLQFAGHTFFEKKSPAFSKNAVHLLVGPMWILGEILGEK